MVSKYAIRGHRHRKRRIRKVGDMQEWTVSSVAVSSQHTKVFTSLETFYFESYVEPPRLAGPHTISNGRRPC